MNRIATAIAAKSAEINDKLAKGVITQEQIDKTHKGLDLEMDLHANFQEIKSLAVANGMMTVDEGMTIYVALGGTVSVFNRQDIATKVVLMGVYQQLLGASIVAKGGKLPAKRRR